MREQSEPGRWVTALQDFRFVLRMSRRAPASAIAIVLTIATGVGVNTVLFDVVDRLLLRSPPGISSPESVFHLELCRRPACRVLHILPPLPRPAKRCARFHVNCSHG